MKLTAKQQARVDAAPPARRAALRQAFTRQNLGSQQRNKQPNQTASKPKPKARPAGVVPAVPRQMTWAFDGFDKRHLPHDEVTAPYTTTNIVDTLEFTSSPTIDKVIVVALRLELRQETNPGPMTDLIAVEYDGSTVISGSMSTLSSLRSNVLGRPQQGSDNKFYSIRGRLHNMSARLSCLGTNTGLYPPGSAYVGTVPMVETGGASGGAERGLTAKVAWADDSISVGYIRPIAAASLQEKPVVVHSAVTENVSYKQWRDFVTPPDGYTIGSRPILTSLEPIIIYVPRAGAGDTVVNYRLEIGQQWCSRHPHDVLLRATQKQHTATPHTVWNGAISAVKDIGEHLLQRAGGAIARGAAHAMRQALPE